MNLSIRFATEEDFEKYSDLLQRTYEQAYVNEKIGLRKEHLSKEVFASDRIKKYLIVKLKKTNNLKTWLAFLGEKLVGVISLIEDKRECIVEGFYVDPDYQGRGIGKELWELVLKNRNGKNIVVEVNADNQKTLDMYRKWGFIRDWKRKVFYHHWPEWPEGIKTKNIYLKLST